MIADGDVCHGDGLTDRFATFGTITGPGPHSLKLAIADAGDSAQDSNLFVRPGGIVIPSGCDSDGDGICDADDSKSLLR